MKNIYIFFAVSFLSVLFITTANANSEPTEYLSIGKEIEFNGEVYELKWSSHPSKEYYKQEYLRKNDSLPEYEKMLMVEAIKGDFPAIYVANGKINELEGWKSINPIVSYEKFEYGKEIVLEFILSSGNIYEWNIYRYRNEKNESGNYLVLYAYSYRNYVSNEEEKNTFLNTIVTTKANLVKKVGNIELPNIQAK
ncbi:hypothetical protein VH441_07740 [Psychrobacter sp. HD31]|uniref:hypothetical protein n=1 Tax=Psychrobacter sp. HD31 TaxID=3112003 RepID=UPI003DA43379